MILPQDRPKPIADARPWLGVSFNHPQINRYLRENGDFFKEHQANATKAWGWVKNGTPLGFYALGCLTIQLPTRLAVPSIYIRALAVHPEHRGKGLGKRLMQHALGNAMAAAEHVPVAMVHLLPQADGAANRSHLERFYAALGFSPMPGSVAYWRISMDQLRQALR